MPTANRKLTETELPEWFDPFPEPNTIPCGWNLQGIVANPDPPVVERPADSPERPSS